MAVYHTVGLYPESNETGEIAIHNDIGYLAAGSNGLRILNLTNPANPQVIGSDSTGIEMRMIEVSGDYAYVVGWTSNFYDVLQIFDVSQPQSPVLITTFSLPDYVQKIVLKDNLLFVCWNFEDWHEYEFHYGMIIYNVSNPNAPVTLCNYALSTFTWDLCISGFRVYVADYQGLKILDISNPSSPQMIGVYYTTYGFRSIAVQDNIAYASYQGLKVLDVQNPTSPVLIGQLGSIGLYDMSVNGNTLFGMSDYGLYSVDISDPMNPVSLSYSFLLGSLTLTVNGNYAYISHWQRGVNIVDVSNPVDVTLIGSVETDGQANAIYVDSGIAYVADYNGGLKTYDVSDPSNPTLSGSLNSDRMINDVYKSGDYAYLASGYGTEGGGLEIINVSNPASPSLMSYLPVQDYAPELVVSGSYAYVADDFNGMKIFNISNPANPVLASTYNAQAYGRALALSGNIICLAGYSSLRLVDVSNPLNPYLRGYYHTNNGCSVAVSGNVAYVADYGVGLLVIDISNPDAPSLISVLTPHTYNYFNHCRVQGNRLYAMDWHWNEVLIYDITNPQSPVLFRSYPNNLYVTDIFAMGDLLYASHGTMGGFSINDINLMENDDSVIPTPLQIQIENYPNPFHQGTTFRFNLPKTMAVSLDIYNLKGQKVRSLFKGSVPKGSHSVIWNNQNDNGEKVASGVYLYRLTTSERTLTKQMLLLR